MILPKAAGLKFNTNYVTDHNRSDIGVDVERIESVKRMANGTMRKYVIADKRTISTSWENLPESSTYTVDRKWGLEEMKSFYAETLGEFDLTITYSDGGTETISVMVTKFDYELTGRGRYDFYSCSISMEEV